MHVRVIALVFDMSPLLIADDSRAARRSPAAVARHGHSNGKQGLEAGRAAAQVTDPSCFRSFAQRFCCCAVNALSPDTAGPAGAP